MLGPLLNLHSGFIMCLLSAETGTHTEMWEKVTQYIYSATVLKYSLMFLHSI